MATLKRKLRNKNSNNISSGVATRWHTVTRHVKNQYGMDLEETEILIAEAGGGGQEARHVGSLVGRWAVLHGVVPDYEVQRLI